MVVLEYPSKSTVPRITPANPALLGEERPDPGEQAEVHREPLAVTRPRLPSERGHAEQRDVRVERDRERERARARWVRVRELERREGEQGHRTRPATEPLRVLGEWPRLCPAELSQPHVQVGDRPPRRQGAPDVPEQHRQRGHAQPEDHVDPGRGEVAKRVGVSEERRDPDEKEQRDGDRLHDDPQRAEHEAGQAGAETGSRLPRTEQRQAPESAEQDERHHEHDPRAPVEEPGWDREILDAPDPVRDEGGDVQGCT